MPATSSVSSGDSPQFEASVAAVLSGLLGDDRNDRNGEEPGAQP